MKPKRIAPEFRRNPGDISKLPCISSSIQHRRRGHAYEYVSMAPAKSRRTDNERTLPHAARNLSPTPVRGRGRFGLLVPLLPRRRGCLPHPGSGQGVGVGRSQGSRREDRRSVWAHQASGREEPGWPALVPDPRSLGGRGGKKEVVVELTPPNPRPTFRWREARRPTSARLHDETTPRIAQPGRRIWPCH